MSKVSVEIVGRDPGSEYFVDLCKALDDVHYLNHVTIVTTNSVTRNAATRHITNKPFLRVVYCGDFEFAVDLVARVRMVGLAVTVVRLDSYFPAA
jgi:hypothetical protein